VSTKNKEQLDKEYKVINHEYDVVIVGAGGAGLRATLGMAAAGLSTACITKVFPTRSHTTAAQGGMSAALGNMGEDNWKWHMYDTVKGSDWLGDQDAIEYMCREAIPAVIELEHYGVPFSRTDEGKIYQRPFGGMTTHYGEGVAQRTCAAADRTGHAILHTLYQQSLKHKAEFFIEYYLTNSENERFMERYAPNAKDLASRDVVSRSMTIEINEGRGVGPDKDHIFLNLQHLGPEVIEERLPGISESAKIFAGVDVTKDPIPVLPTVHYNMGGIPTNYRGEVVTVDGDNPDAVVPGLMAIGECACVSVHGANRLGSNSLLDIVVFGRAAAIRAAEVVDKDAPHLPLKEGTFDALLGRFDKTRNADGKESTAQIRDKMQRAMQKYAAVFRTGDNMKEGVEELQALFDSYADIGITDRGLKWNTDLLETLELENLLAQAQVTIAGALHREESRGGHSREDFPDRDDTNWMKHTLAWIDDAGKVSFGDRPVHMYTLTDDCEVIPPKKRVY